MFLLTYLLTYLLTLKLHYRQVTITQEMVSCIHNGHGHFVVSVMLYFTSAKDQ